MILVDVNSPSRCSETGDGDLRDLYTSPMPFFVEILGHRQSLCLPARLIVRLLNNHDGIIVLSWWMRRVSNSVQPEGKNEMRGLGATCLQGYRVAVMALPTRGFLLREEMISTTLKPEDGDDSA